MIDRFKEILCMILKNRKRLCRVMDKILRKKNNVLNNKNREILLQVFGTLRSQ